MVFRVVGLCQGCVRYHPNTTDNCKIAKEWLRLQRKYECEILLTGCSKFFSPDVVFPEREEEE